jgi:hypothetical protein
MLPLLPLPRIYFDNIGVEILFSLSLRVFILLNYNSVKIEILNDLIPCFGVSNYFLSMFDLIFEHLYVLH